MAGFDGSGNFTRVYSWQAEANAGTGIVADHHDSEDDNFAKAFNNTFCRDGQSPATGDFNMGGKKIKGLTAASNVDEAVTLGQLTGAGADPTPDLKKSLQLAGSDANGRVNFMATTGVNGFGWKGADVSFVGRLTDTDKWRNRLALNNTFATTTGADVLTIDEGGWMSYPAWSYNLAIDQNGLYRTPAAGWPGYASMNGGLLQLLTADAATTTAWNTTPTPRVGFQVDPRAKNCTIALYKNGASGQIVQILGYNLGTLRWQMILGEGTAEGGTYNGSDFALYAYNNSGAGGAPRLAINRATGDVTHYGQSYLGTGFIGHTGMSGGYYGNVHNFAYGGSAVMSAYVNDVGFGISMTVCDHRIKQEVQPLQGAWDAIKALRPVSYKHREFGRLDKGPAIVADDKLRWGFVAHEAGAVHETMAIGEKDHPDMLQSLDLVPVVAALVSALQEAMVRIEALEARA